ncbi:hypothetical protein EBB07_32745 [Paenibacillaceae bacterium]|nr:hypothetical protein EBB07_32745 [Paenibacillaceae bacterium]
MYGESYQQGSFQGQQSQSSFGQANNNRYQPTGYVPSQYQGQLRQSNFGSSQNVGPVISHLGYQASSQQGIFNNQFAQQNNMSHFGAQTQQQPVISHVGYEAGRDYYPRAAAASMNQSYNQGYQQHSPSNQQYSNSNNSQPVISQLGYQVGQNNRTPVLNSSSQFGNYSGQQGGQQASMHQNSYAHAQTPINPVYQASNAQHQEGPVISHLGYQTGSQYGSNGMNGQNNRF